MSFPSIEVVERGLEIAALRYSHRAIGSELSDSVSFVSSRSWDWLKAWVVRRIGFVLLPIRRGQRQYGGPDEPNCEADQ